MIKRKTMMIDGVGDMETTISSLTANGLRYLKAAQLRL